MGPGRGRLTLHGLRVTYAAHDLENTRRDLIALRVKRLVAAGRLGQSHAEGGMNERLQE